MAKRQHLVYFKKFYIAFLDSFHHETNMMDILSSNGSKREAY
jgi:hypothetical protein